MHSLYRYYSALDDLLYVGISHNPFTREKQHKYSDKDMSLVRVIEVEWFECRIAASKAEGLAIRREKPLWNIVAPIKARTPKVTPKQVIARPNPATSKPRIPTYYRNVGPHLPPMQGPPKPWKRYAVGSVPDASRYHHVFKSEDIGRAFKVARKGDVITFGYDVKVNPDALRAMIEGQIYHV